MLLAFPTSSLEPSEPRKQVYSSPHRPPLPLLHSPSHAVICPFIHSQIFRAEAMPGKAWGGPCRLTKAQAAIPHSACASAYISPARAHLLQ